MVDQQFKPVPQPSATGGPPPALVQHAMIRQLLPSEVQLLEFIHQRHRTIRGGRAAADGCNLHFLQPASGNNQAEPLNYQYHGTSRQMIRTCQQMPPRANDYTLFGYSSLINPVTLCWQKMSQIASSTRLSGINASQRPPLSGRRPEQTRISPMVICGRLRICLDRFGRAPTTTVYADDAFSNGSNDQMWNCQGEIAAL